MPICHYWACNPLIKRNNPGKKSRCKHCQKLSE